MYVTQVGNNTITACGFCDLLIFNRLKNPDALHKLCEQLKEHLNQSPACKTYYDALPTLEDVRGILKNDKETP